MLRFYASQHDNPDAKWRLNDDADVVYGNTEGELTIGGVFLRLFIANPGWVLRRPKEFITELLEKWSQIVESGSPNVSVVRLRLNAGPDLICGMIQK